MKRWRRGAGRRTLRIKTSPAASAARASFSTRLFGWQHGELRREFERYCKRLCRKREATNWPGPLGTFVLGRMTEADLRSKITSHRHCARGLPAKPPSILG